MHKHLKKASVLHAFLLAIMLVVFADISSAQSSTETPSELVLPGADTLGQLVVQTLNGQVTLYGVSAMGDVMPLSEANQTINTKLARLSPATLQSPSDVALSADGTKLARVAYTYDGTNQVNLLVYSFVSDTILETSLPGYGSIVWSPTSEHILLSPPPYNGFDLVTNLRDIYIYDAGQAALAQVTDTPTGRGEHNIVWIPGTSTIVFTREEQPCSMSCTGSVENLFMIQTDGTGLQQVTHIDQVLPVAIPYPYNRCLNRDVQWNAVNQRVYFVVSCEDGDRELLLSTTLSGSARIELNLPALFPTDSSVVYSHLQVNDFHIDPSINRIIVVASVEASHLDRLDSDKLLRIYDLFNTVVNEIFTSTFSFSLFISSSTRNTGSNALAIGFLDARSGGGGMLQTVDLTTSDAQLQMLETENGVCNLVWLGLDRVAFDQLYEGLCRGAANEVRIWNIQTHEVIDIGIRNGVQIVE